MSERDIEVDLRRVLTDPSRRLPDSLVPLERIHDGARRRKARRHALAATAGASTIAAAIVVAIGTGHLLGGTPLSRAVTDRAGPVSAANGPSATASRLATTPTPTTSASVPKSSLPVPAGFSPLSVTAISPQHWWVLGSGGLVATTSDGGQSFALAGKGSVSGPAGGAVELRFADRSHGWAVSVTGGHSGYSLWQTVDGGASWHGVRLVGTVTAVEVGGGQVYALVNTGTDRWAVWRSAVAGDPTWRSAGNLGSLTMAPVLAVQSGRAIVVAWGAGGALTWVFKPGSSSSSPAPCTPDLGAEDLSATTDGVWLVCGEGTADSLWRSDDGAVWAQVPVAGPAERFRVGAIDAGDAALGLPDGSVVRISTSGQTSTATAPTTGVTDWTYLAFTNPRDGFALDDSGALLRTTDGGESWRQVAFR
jgi:photosystem II stability/assembly factor-like uncharacterized protein